MWLKTIFVPAIRLRDCGSPRYAAFWPGTVRPRDVVLLLVEDDAPAKCGAVGTERRRLVEAFDQYSAIGHDHVL